MSLHYVSEEIARKFPHGESLAFARQGDALLREQRAEEAISVLREGVRRYPRYIAGFLVLGRAYKDMGRISEAKVEFENALRLDSHCPAALSLLAWIEETQKETAESVSHLSALAAQEPWDEDFQTAAHRNAPEPVKAPPVVARVVHLSPSDPKPPKVEVEDEFEEDEESGGMPSHVATVTLAEIYFQQGLKEQALQIYRQLLERQPENETVKKRLTEIEASTA